MASPFLELSRHTGRTLRRFLEVRGDLAHLVARTLHGWLFMDFRRFQVVNEQVRMQIRFTGLDALGLVAAVGLGLSLSAVSLNMQQAMLYSFVLIMPLMLLSGLTTPIENMPRALQLATYLNPLRFAVDLVQRVYLEGATLSSLWHDLIPLALIAAVTLPLAAWMFRHRLT